MPEGQVGSSPIAQAFGADIQVVSPQHRLFLVIGRAAPPVALVHRFGGRVVFQLPETNKLLAILPVDVQPLFLSHPQIALCGPVTIDPVRFAQFVALIGLDNGNGNGR
jgi:hypothetical protein